MHCNFKQHLSTKEKMASAQSVAQLNDKEKAAIAEAIGEAQNQVANNNAKASQEQLVLTVGNLKNAQRRALRLAHTHSWQGRFVINPPQNGSGGFVHEGAYSQGSGEIVLPVVVGSKGAVVYSTIDMMYPGLGYLVAWYKPENPSLGISKVYAEVGDSSKFVNMDWKQIEQKLDASAGISRYWDSVTGGSISAEIKDESDKLAVLAAIFN